MSTHASPLLLIEEDQDTAGLICKVLRDHFGTNCVLHRPGLTETLEMDTSKFDLILLDLNTSDGSALQFVDQLLERRKDQPVILITAERTIETAFKAMQRGAYDYLIKTGHYISTIPIVVEKNLAVWRTKQENRRLQEQLEKTLDELQVKNNQLEEMVQQLKTMAGTDPLTGMANRRAIAQTLERSFADSQRHHRDLACLMIDLDAFKPLNDTLGHQRGDEVLQLTAKALLDNCRRSDFAGRFGGDEFIVLLPQTDAAQAQVVARRMVEHFGKAAQAVPDRGKLAQKPSMSIGIATYKQSQPETAEQLIAFADHALYRAKQSTDTRVATYEPPSASSSQKPAA